MLVNPFDRGFTSAQRRQTPDLCALGALGNANALWVGVGAPQAENDVLLGLRRAKYAQYIDQTVIAPLRQVFEA